MKIISYRKKNLVFWISIFVCTSIILVIAGEYHTMVAWWFAFILLFPPLWLALKTSFITLKTICLVSFFTQIISLPFFYLYRDRFAWGHVKPFNFTALDAFPILVKVSFFLAILVISFIWLYRIKLIGGTQFKSRKIQIQNSFNMHGSSAFNTANNVNSVTISIVLFVFIILLSAINLWSYSNGVGLTGIEPPNLPFRLSGIIFYLMKYITPTVLAYLYFKTKRTWPLMLLFLCYALIFGLCSVSKGAVIVIMFPVLVLAWLDGRKFMFAVASFGMLICISLAAGARTYVYAISDGKTAADSSFGLFTLLLTLLTDSNSLIFEYDFIPLAISQIAERIEGFNNLVMSQYYDPNAVVGAWGFILRMIWADLVAFDTNLHSIQWQGNILPEGFYNGGSLLSNAVIIGNDGFEWIALSALVTSIILIIIEKSCNRLKLRYEIFSLLNVPVKFSLAFIFFTTTGGVVTFVYPFLLLFIFSYIPSRYFLSLNRMNRKRSFAF